MHGQLVGEFHHQAKHERVAFSAVFQEIRHPVRVGDRFGDTVEDMVIALDIYMLVSLDGTVPAHFDKFCKDGTPRLRQAIRKKLG